MRDTVGVTELSCRKKPAGSVHMTWLCLIYYMIWLSLLKHCLIQIHDSLGFCKSSFLKVGYRWVQFLWTLVCLGTASSVYWSVVLYTCKCARLASSKDNNKTSYRKILQLRKKWHVASDFVIIFFTKFQRTYKQL